MTIRVSIAEMAAIQQGFLVKQVVVGQCPKAGDGVNIVLKCMGFPYSPDAVENGKIYAKERIGDAVPKAYRIIFGRD